jgi:hypothetical protein
VKLYFSLDCYIHNRAGTEKFLSFFRNILSDLCEQLDIPAGCLDVLFHCMAEQSSIFVFKWAKLNAKGSVETLSRDQQLFAWVQKLTQLVVNGGLAEAQYASYICRVEILGSVTIALLQSIQEGMGHALACSREQ